MRNKSKIWCGAIAVMMTAVMLTACGGVASRKEFQGKYESVANETAIEKLALAKEAVKGGLTDALDGYELDASSWAKQTATDEGVSYDAVVEEQIKAKTQPLGDKMLMWVMRSQKKTTPTENAYLKAEVTLLEDVVYVRAEPKNGAVLKAKTQRTEEDLTLQNEVILSLEKMIGIVAMLTAQHLDSELAVVKVSQDNDGTRIQVTLNVQKIADEMQEVIMPIGSAESQNALKIVEKEPTQLYISLDADNGLRGVSMQGDLTVTTTKSEKSKQEIRMKTKAILVGYSGKIAAPFGADSYKTMDKFPEINLR